MGSASRNFVLRGAVAPLFVLVVAALALFAAPSAAHARSYSVDRVDIDLTVNTDGSISVVESRAFNFDGSFNGVYWDIAYAAPDTHASLDDPQLTVASVEDLTSGGSEFRQATSGANGTYELQPQGGEVTRLKIYAAHEDETATIRIAYKVTNVVNAWADTGELYWKFVSNGWEVPSDNVTCRVHLPVPSGASVTPGDNARAWGHGPLDASVAFDGNDVVYTVPGVGADEYAEARVTFPVAWLTGVTPSTSARLDTILSEEQQWADAANAKREQARAEIATATLVAFAFPVLALAFSLLRYRRYKAAHAPQFREQYFRDVPSQAHPAALGCLYLGGSVSGEQFTATLMRLADSHAIELEAVRNASGAERDYLIRRGAGVASSRIDFAVLHLLFDVVAPWGDAACEDRLYFSDFKRVAKKHAEEYADALEEWRSCVTAACEENGYFTDTTKAGRALSIVAFVLLNLVAALAAGVLFFMGAVAQAAIALAMVVVSCVACGMLVAKMKPLSAEGVELVAKLGALRRWLTDFTLLKEAVPRDVVLWNRLLVMAVVLGVADRVIEQLRMVAPEVLEDPGFATGYFWCRGHGRLGSPADVVAQSYQAAHSVSTSELASSESSSGGGFGGGGAF